MTGRAKQRRSGAARKQLLAGRECSPLSNRQQKNGLVFAQRFKQRILREAP
jgi:hypothetical protein